MATTDSLPTKRAPTRAATPGGGERRQGERASTHTKHGRKRRRGNKFVAGDATPLPAATLLSSLSFYLSFCSRWSLDARRGRNGKKKKKEGLIDASPLSPLRNALFSFTCLCSCVTFLTSTLTVDAPQTVVSRGFGRKHLQ